MKYLYFSPKSTTKRMAETVATAWPKAEPWDLLKQPADPTPIPADEPVLVALPVYAGRIPPHCIRQLEGLKGNGGPAVALVAYGNRAYDDALLELCQLLEGHGFRVIAAGAFVGQHSIFTQVAKGRPDQEDLALLTDFGQRCRAKADSFDPAAHTPLTVPGNPDYGTRPAAQVPFHPTGNRNCIKCRTCVVQCPVGAIPTDEPTRTEGDRCITCGRCIYICPVDARGYFFDAFPQSAQTFAEKNAAYRTPEWFGV